MPHSEPQRLNYAAAAYEPVAVLDIGSNSVRLVIYERLARSLTPLYNEKAAAQLGHGVAETGRMADENIAIALSAFERFAKVLRHLEVPRLHLIATSAVREASNGPEFMAQTEAILGVAGRVLSGEEEAHFAAFGVIAGMPGFDGLIGDLGGGSLELARIDNGFDSRGETLGLGVIRLTDDSDGKPKRAFSLAQDRLAAAQLIREGEGGCFAAIGGTWRALAKLHQTQENYPLRMVHAYLAPAKSILKLCDDILDEKLDAELLRTVGSSRRSLLPYGAAVMKAVIERGEFDSVLFSALGVREGYLFGQLSDDQRAEDPLWVAVELFNAVRSRVPNYAYELLDFTDRVFAACDLVEAPADYRLRRAACFLSDIGWRGHPDYRGEQSVDLVAYSAMAGVDHAGRAFLAEALAVRYMGLSHDSLSHRLAALVTDEGHKRAQIIGALFRVAYNLAPAIPGILANVMVSRTEDGIILNVPSSQLLFDSGRLDRRLKQLSIILEKSVSLAEIPD